MFENAIFAGGGSRCVWQLGFWQGAIAAGLPLDQTVDTRAAYARAEQHLDRMPMYSVARGRMLSDFERRDARSARNSEIKGDWEQLGPTNVGGRMTSIVTHPADADRIWRDIEAANAVRLNTSSCQVYMALQPGVGFDDVGDLLFHSEHDGFDVDALLSRNVSSRTFSFRTANLRTISCVPSVDPPSTTRISIDWGLYC